MILVWGTYAYRHPRASATLEMCTSCGQQAVEPSVLERTSHFLFAPLFPRAFRTVTRCTHCQRVEIVPGRRGDTSRRAFAWRTILSWALLAGVVGAAVLGDWYAGRQAEAHAAAPAVGDEWTIRTARWPDPPPGMLAYARVRVDGVDHDAVTLSACEFTSDRESAIEKKCTSYPAPAGSVPAAEVPSLVERGAITSIWRGGDPARPFQAVAGGLGVAMFVFGLLARRAAKRSHAGEDPLPRATLA